METLKYVRANDRLAAGDASPGVVDWDGTLGTWHNTDPETGEIQQIILSEDQGTLRIHAFGACRPALCDWGEVEATPHVAHLAGETLAGFEARYDFGFMETVLAANVKRGILVIQSYNTFKDGSGRASYFTREFFHQHVAHAGPATPPRPDAPPFMLAADLPRNGPARAGIDLRPFLGTWRNTHRDTDAIQHFTLSYDDGAYHLHVTGAGAPRDWGRVEVTPCADAVDSATAAGFLARYALGFADVVLAANDNHGILIIASYHLFNDDSGRSNYFRREFFYRDDG